MKMMMFKKISLFILLNFIPLLVYAGNYTFKPPVSGWKPYEGDTYDTFEKEDKDHKCATKNGGKKNDTCKKEGQDSSGAILRNCGYNDMCSVYGLHHSGIDYDWNNHNHPIYNIENSPPTDHLDLDDIVAVNDGTVVLVTKNGKGDRGLGNSIIIEHFCDNTKLCPNGKIYSLYGHLAKIEVEDKDFVHKGKVIGLIGGTANGEESRWITHLHFEFKTEGVLDSPECSGVGYTKKDASQCGYRNPADYFGDCFLDVNSGTTYRDEICKLKKHNFVDGYSDGKFRPTEVLIRQDFLKVVMLLKYNKDKIKKYENEESKYSDINKGMFINKYANLALSEGIISKNDKFRPDKKITLIEAAKIIINTLDIEVRNKEKNEEWYIRYLDKLKELGVKMDNYSSNSEITRGYLTYIISTIKKL